MAGQMFGNAPPAFAPPPQQPQPHAQHAPQGGGARVTCPGCSAQVAPGKFCVECGKSLPEVKAGPKFCASCGAALAGKFCAQCGTPAA
jgi:predicted amidophosphoribosyltransferase